MAKTGKKAVKKLEQKKTEKPMFEAYHAKKYGKKLPKKKEMID